MVPKKITMVYFATKKINGNVNHMKMPPTLGVVEITGKYIKKSMNKSELSPSTEYKHKSKQYGKEENQETKTPLCK